MSDASKEVPTDSKAIKDLMLMKREPFEFESKNCVLDLMAISCNFNLVNNNHLKESNFSTTKLQVSIIRCCFTPFF